MIIRDKFYINGEWVPALGQETLDVVDASTEEVMGKCPLALQKMLIAQWKQRPLLSKAGV